MTTSVRLELDESYDWRFWQEGVAGSCNIVSFDGEDIKGVLWIPDQIMRARVIEAHNKTVRSMLRHNEQ